MREASWNRIGTDITSANDISTALAISGLDYTVKTAPLTYNVDGRDLAVSNKMITYREDDPSKAFGIVSDSYHICQNADAFDFINYIDGDVRYIKAGETYNGLVYIIGELPEIDVLGDVVRPNIIFQNSHNGLGSVKSNICMLRIVCQNQFAHAFKDSTNSVSIRHAATMDEKLIAARQTLSETYRYIENYKWHAEDLAGKHISDADLQKVIKQIIVKSDDAEIISKSNNVIKIERFLNAYNNDDNQNFRGSAWGVINAFTDYATHPEKTGRATEKFEDNVFINNTLYNPDLDKLVYMMNEIAA